MEWLDSFTKALRTLLEFREALALIAGTILAIAGTQYIKFQIANRLNRRRIVLLTLPLGFWPTYALWPADDGWELRCVMGLIVGFCSPIVYKSVVWLIARKKPELAGKMSASL